MRNPRPAFAVALACALFARAEADPNKPATQADIERLEKQIAEQRKLIENLVQLQQQYAASLAKLLENSGSGAPPVLPETPESAHPKPKKLDLKPHGKGEVAGKVTGASDAYVYIDDFVERTGGAAVMKQEGKRFVPRVLVVQKGTRVDFPNMDAVFHNVFSVTPDNSFDLGSYRKGDSKSVTMVNPGVVNVYCNMHSQMVGYILVVPNGSFARVGSDGAYRLGSIPAGHHRVVVWAPNAKPVVKEVEIGDTPATADFSLVQSQAGPHLMKDGLPYGSYME
jgi:plastocyanin